MKRQRVWFEAVQVVSRDEDGSLKEWWPGEQKASLREAKEAQRERALEAPGLEIAIIQKTVVECDHSRIGVVRDGGVRRVKPFVAEEVAVEACSGETPRS
jgi:hypothetical protein